MTMTKPKAKARKPPFEVTEPMQYTADDGYFFDVIWRPKYGPPYSMRCHASTLGAVPVIRDASIVNMRLVLKALRDELVKAPWLESQQPRRSRDQTKG